MRLLAVELNRFRSRRAIALLMLAAAVLAVVLAGVTAWNTRPLTQEDRTDAAAQADLEGQKPEIQQEVRACRAAPTDFLGPVGDRRRVRGRTGPGPRRLLPARRAQPGAQRCPPAGLGLPLAVVVVSLMVIAGCTFVGADWASGSMTNQLLFVPRRTRVWLAKAGAVDARLRRRRPGGRSPRFWLILALVAQARDIDDAVARGRARGLARRTRDAAGDGRRARRVRADDGLPAHRRDPGAAVRLQHRRRDRGQPARLRGGRTLVGGQQRARLAGAALPLLRRQHRPAPPESGAARCR